MRHQGGVKNASPADPARQLYMCPNPLAHDTCAVNPHANPRGRIQIPAAGEVGRHKRAPEFSPRPGDFDYYRRRSDFYRRKKRESAGLAMSSGSLDGLDTPCLVLERGKLERNLARMRDHLAKLKVALRPHVKTAKSYDVARLALSGQPGGITVSTLKEAEQFFAHGITDILYAVGITPHKLDHVAELRRKGADITIILDNVESARIVAVRGAELGVRFPALIEIDSDGHRSGVKPADAALIEIGRMLESGAGAQLRGVMTHAGDSYNCDTVEKIRAMAVRERDAVVRCATRLREAGLPCPIVSVGSTPTATYSENLDGVTEVRAGVYMFFDLVMAGLNVCTIDDIAVSVLATVIGHQPDKSWIITDAGWMAMSRDRGTASQKVDQGYGVVCDVAGAPLKDLLVVSTNQEHGIIGRRGGGALDAAKYPVGTLLRVLPNHTCATAAQHDRYHVVEGDTRVSAIWPRFSGW
jgi:D-serine deaminase-like pyridoxal phosphate-dependent protein